MTYIAMIPPLITHRGTSITTLSGSQSVDTHCAPGHIAILEQGDGWWLYFVDEDGNVDGYESPFASHAEALWAAKAAAEFSGE